MILGLFPSTTFLYIMILQPKSQKTRKVHPEFSNILGITKSLLLLYCSKNPFACFFPLFINLFVSDIFCHFHVLFPNMTYHCLHIFFTFRTFMESWQLAHTSPRLWYSLYPSPFTVRYNIQFSRHK